VTNTKACAPLFTMMNEAASAFGMPLVWRRPMLPTRHALIYANDACKAVRYTEPNSRQARRIR